MRDEMDDVYLLGLPAKKRSNGKKISQLLHLSPEEYDLNKTSVWSTCQSVMKETGVTIEMSNSGNGILTFLINGYREEVLGAQQQILNSVNYKVSLCITPKCFGNREDFLKTLLNIEKGTETRITINNWLLVPFHDRIKELQENDNVTVCIKGKQPKVIRAYRRITSRLQLKEPAVAETSCNTTQLLPEHSKSTEDAPEKNQVKDMSEPELEDLQSNLSILQINLRATEKELEESQKKLRDTESRFQDSQKNLKCTENVLQDLEKDFQKKEKDLQDLQKDLAGKEYALQNLQKVLNNLRLKENELQNLQKGFKEKENELHDMQKDFMVKESELQDLQVKFEESQNKKEELENRLKEITRVTSCPICFESMSRDVVCCIHGHVICRGCKKNQKQCPICRKGFSGEGHTFISQLLEALLDHCSNGGCQKSSRDKQEIEAHEKLFCSFRTIQCKECGWDGKLKDLKNHVLSTHFFEECEGEDQLYLHLLERDLSKIPLTYFDEGLSSSLFSECCGQILWRPQILNTNKERLTLKYICVPNEQMEKCFFSVKVEFESDGSKLSAETRLAKNHEDGVMEGSLIFDTVMLEKFKKGDRLKYKFIIQKHKE